VGKAIRESEIDHACGPKVGFMPLQVHVESHQYLIIHEDIGCHKVRNVYSVLLSTAVSSDSTW
jgi:hypothetical protein